MVMVKHVYQESIRNFIMLGVNREIEILGCERVTCGRNPLILIILDLLEIWPKVVRMTFCFL